MGKWTYSILIMLLLVMTIDLNINQRSWQSPGGLSLPVVDLMLGGLVILLTLLLTIKNRR